MEQAPVISEERLKDLTSLFQQYDPETKGCTDRTNFPTLIKAAGFELNNQKVLDNLLTYYMSTGVLYFMEFMEIVTLLTIIKVIINAFI